MNMRDYLEAFAEENRVVVEEYNEDEQSGAFTVRFRPVRDYEGWEPIPLGDELKRIIETYVTDSLDMTELQEEGAWDIIDELVLRLRE